MTLLRMSHFLGRGGPGTTRGAPPCGGPRRESIDSPLSRQHKANFAASGHHYTLVSRCCVAMIRRGQRTSRVSDPTGRNIAKGVGRAADPIQAHGVLPGGFHEPHLHAGRAALAVVVAAWARCGRRHCRPALMSDRLHRVWIMFVVLAFCFCQKPAKANDDFSVDDRLDQSIALNGAQRVVVRCFCFKRELREVRGSRDVTLRLSANLSSVGYHGKQEKRTRIPEALMRFRETRDGDAVMLESREYTFIHHVFMLKD